MKVIITNHKVQHVKDNEDAHLVNTDLSSDIYKHTTEKKLYCYQIHMKTNLRNLNIIFPSTDTHVHNYYYIFKQGRKNKVRARSKF